MTIRPATLDDLDFIVVLADENRRRCEQHAPVFHRPAADAPEVHRPWLAALIENDDVVVILSQEQDGTHDGFIVATLVPSPPVYDPGGATWSIDDFVVADSMQWGSVGRNLLWAAQAWGRARGAAQSVVVCGAHDEPKRQMRADSGLHVVSEWFTAPLQQWGNGSL